jgi:hypothetical protein
VCVFNETVGTKYVTSFKKKKENKKQQQSVMLKDYLQIDNASKLSFLLFLGVS